MTETIDAILNACQPLIDNLDSRISHHIQRTELISRQTILGKFAQIYPAEVIANLTDLDDKDMQSQQFMAQPHGYKFQSLVPYARQALEVCDVDVTSTVVRIQCRAHQPLSHFYCYINNREFVNCLKYHNLIGKLDVTINRQSCRIAFINPAEQSSQAIESLEHGLCFPEITQFLQFTPMSDLTGAFYIQLQLACDCHFHLTDENFLNCQAWPLQNSFIEDYPPQIISSSQPISLETPPQTYLYQIDSMQLTTQDFQNLPITTKGSFWQTWENQSCHNTITAEGLFPGVLSIRAMKTNRIQPRLKFTGLRHNASNKTVAILAGPSSTQIPLRNTTAHVQSLQQRIPQNLQSVWQCLRTSHPTLQKLCHDVQTCHTTHRAVIHRGCSQHGYLHNIVVDNRSHPFEYGGILMLLLQALRIQQPLCHHQVQLQFRDEQYVNC